MLGHKQSRKHIFHLKKMRNNLTFWLISVMQIFGLVSFVACTPILLEEPAHAEPIELTEEPTEEPTKTKESMEEHITEVDFPVMPAGALEEALKGTYAGTTVTVNGPFEGNDPDGVKMTKSVAAFEEATGITVNYNGSKEFERNLKNRVDSGDTPDIVDFPQPLLLADFVRSGDVVPVTNFISVEWLSQQYNLGWRELNTIDGVEVSIMHRYNSKSLVWYPKAAWDKAGYEIPESWDELMTLTQTIADKGDAAWCIGIESGAITGWVATDWTEDVILRNTSLENYDAWVIGNLAFDSTEVKKAIETWSELWFNDDYVYGGHASITTTFFGDSPAPMFEDPPQCWLHRQADFINVFFPEGAEYGVDYDFFYLPPIDEQHSRPLLVAGDLIAMFNDRPEVRALMEYFTTPHSVSGWLEGGGAIAAHQTATQDMYDSKMYWNISQLALEATSYRFDGSDLMPREVAGSFWEQISSYVAGNIDLDTAMQEIDASWPAN
jgi:alpha-glucoside transport system substrate-binding protein